MDLRKNIFFNQKTPMRAERVRLYMGTLVMIFISKVKIKYMRKFYQ